MRFAILALAVTLLGCAPTSPEEKAALDLATCLWTVKTASLDELRALAIRGGTYDIDLVNLAYLWGVQEFDSLDDFRAHLSGRLRGDDLDLRAVRETTVVLCGENLEWLEQ